jgi:hypothetical protein
MTQAQVDAACREIEAAALKKWAKTELYVRQFSNQVEERMRQKAWGPDTGTLDRSIKSEEKSLGVFSLEVTTSIEDNVNPDTGISAAVYGSHIERGHYNVFLRQSIPPVLFMEGGASECYAELLGKLQGLWSGP